MLSTKSRDLRKKEGRWWWYCPSDHLQARHHSSMLQPCAAQSRLCTHLSYQSTEICLQCILDFQTPSFSPWSAFFSWNAFPCQSLSHIPPWVGKCFRFCKTHCSHIFKFLWKLSLATTPTNPSHLGLVRQIQAVTCDLCLSANPLPFIAPPFSQSIKQILPTPFTLQMCRSHGKGTPFFTPHLQGTELTGNLYSVFLCHSHCGARASDLAAYCAPPLSAGKRSAIRHLNIHLFAKFCCCFPCSQMPLCILVVICKTLGVSWKSQDLGSEASPSRLPPCHPFQMSFLGRHNSSCLPLLQWKCMDQNT